jgi:hypothetical protein
MDTPRARAAYRSDGGWSLTLDMNLDSHSWIIGRVRNDPNRYVQEQARGAQSGPYDSILADTGVFGDLPVVAERSGAFCTAAARSLRILQSTSASRRHRETGFARTKGDTVEWAFLHE